MGSPDETWDKRVDLLCQTVDIQLLLTYLDVLSKLVGICDVKTSGWALVSVNVDVGEVSSELGSHVVGTHIIDRCSNTSVIHLL